MNLANRAATKIVAREDPDKWRFPDLNELWSGLPERPGNPTGSPTPAPSARRCTAEGQSPDATHAPRHDLFLTLTPNPALDIATSTEQVLPTQAAVRHGAALSGRGGINVARVLQPAWALR